MLDIAFAKPALPKTGALVLLINEGEKPSGLWAQLDEATGGAIGRAFEVAEFKGAKGKTCMILAPGANLSRVLAVGLRRHRRQPVARNHRRRRRHHPDRPAGRRGRTGCCPAQLSL
jgi:hypothetical protein